MRAVVQRVKRASCVVNGDIISAIENGYMVLLGVSEYDEKNDVDYIVKKLIGLRIFEDEEGKMNKSLTDVNGGMLLISQFTLYGDVRKGNRPSFSKAAKGDYARVLYEEVMSKVRASGIIVYPGVFGAHMEIELLNDGPVTILLDSRREF